MLSGASREGGQALHSHPLGCQLLAWSRALVGTVCLRGWPGVMCPVPHPVSDAKERVGMVNRFPIRNGHGTFQNSKSGLIAECSSHKSVQAMSLGTCCIIFIHSQGQPLDAIPRKPRGCLIYGRLLTTES